MVAIKKNCYSFVFAVCLSGNAGLLLACPTMVYSPTSRPGVSYKHHWNSSKKKIEKKQKDLSTSENTVSSSESVVPNSESTVAK
ncbi:MAG: hypothetical protein P4L53_16010 [Candidatus Obscuribacterales bacterium]|nr:hypothetical protein [Candidatus Obscuribacterales bacterium]